MRERILDTASRLYASKGYDAVSMRHVATALGMTQANLYYYFKDKQDLILSSLAYVFNGKRQAFDAVMHVGGSPTQRLERGILWFATLLFEDAIFSKLYFREMLDGDATRLQFLTENVFQEPFRVLVGLVEDAVDTPDPMLAALFLTSTLVGYFQFSGIIRHLRETKARYLDPKTITQFLMQEIRKSLKIPCPGSELS
jgi:AcrR family transcriptional regulator